MTTYYVSAAGDNSTGLSWAAAKTTLAGAIALATASGDVIKIDKDHTGDNALASDTTWTVLNNISIICVDKDSGDALAEMGTAAWLGSSTASVALTIAGAYSVRLHGITLRLASNAARAITLASSDGSHFETTKLYLWQGSTSSSTNITIGAGTNNSYCSLKEATIRFGNAGQSISLRDAVDVSGLIVSSSGTAPSALFVSCRGLVRMFDCDLSFVGAGTLAGAHGAAVAAQYELYRCKLGTNYVALGTQSPANKGSATIMLSDCSSGDTHGIMHYADAFGSVVSDAGIYYTAGAAGQSWKVTTTAACSTLAPFTSPWIAAYHNGTASITPRLEILRDGSATAYQHDEVWSEWAAKVTSGTVLGTSYSDGMPLLGTPADQAAGAGTGSWTGEAGTAWSGKCDSGAAFTPAETGEIMARIVVGEPSITVYVDPQIRTA